MFKLFLGPLISATLWFVLSTTVFADTIAEQTDTFHFNGFYAGLGVGRGSVKDPYYELKRSDGLPNGWSGQHDDQSNTFTLSIGHNWRFNEYVIGIEGRLQKRSYNDESYQIDNTGSLDTDSFTSYESNLSKQLLLRLGRLIDDKSLAYASFGRVQTDYRRSYTTTLFGGASDIIDGADQGTIFGVGFERMIGRSYSVRGEINYVWYDQTVTNPAAWSRINDYHDPTESNVSLSIIRHF